MSRYIHPIAASLIFVVSAFTAIHSENWKISEDYSIKFTGNNATGIFKGLKGNVIFDAADPGSSSFNVTVDVATINTGSGMKNAHAKSEKWFDAKKYPTIGFKSSSITKTASGYA
ncbi:MAG TPA: YceI family protein, partial [Puia sp.]|nr:YceI family protein [Puia sp.]